ncbi:MAG: S4 domain-containing protein [Butyricicoccus pullicaecorum]
MARERLDKMLASRGAGSRKEVGGLIRTGRVTVNGAACRDPACKVDADVDTICVDGGRCVRAASGILCSTNRWA